MECISVFDMLKIGIGPSSSHTLGPWRAAERWINELKTNAEFDAIKKVTVDLYGSLSLTGRGHATDYAVMLGLSGLDPETIPTENIDSTIASIKNSKTLVLNNEHTLPFDPESDIVFNRKFLPFHSNGLTFTALIKYSLHLQASHTKLCSHPMQRPAVGCGSLYSALAKRSSSHFQLLRGFGPFSAPAVSCGIL